MTLFQVNLKSVHEFAKEIIEAKNRAWSNWKIQREHKCWFNINRRSDAWHKWLWRIKEIRELNSDVIIITQSAFGLMETGKALSAGNDYITKP
jgi:hypothetical protein